MKSWLLAAVSGVGLVAIGACGGGDVISDTSGTSVGAPSNESGAPPPGNPGSQADASSGVPVSAGTAGCGLAGAKTGLQDKTTTVGGEKRRYQTVAPAGYDASKPTRLVFVFHGLGGTGDEIRAYFGFEAEAGASGASGGMGGQAIFVYPDGVERFQGSTAWSQVDLAFFDTTLTETSAAYCVDTKRVFAAGHSFGAYMSNLVGCERGDVVRAIAPVSGGIVAGACKGPVATWLAHGDNDSIVAQSEGLGARDHWLSANGCAATSKPTTPSPCVAYDGCSANHPVTWCSFAGGHYPLPKFIKQGIWDFFAAM